MQSECIEKSAYLMIKRNQFSFEAQKLPLLHTALGENMLLNTNWYQSGIYQALEQIAQ